MFTAIKQLWKTYKAFRQFVRDLDAKGVKLMTLEGGLSTREWLLNNGVDKYKGWTGKWPFTKIKSDDALLEFLMGVFKSDRVKQKLEAENE